MDETPVHCFPSLKGTYEVTSVGNVYIPYSDGKRMITGSPVTDPDGSFFFVPIAVEGHKLEISRTILQPAGR